VFVNTRRVAIQMGLFSTANAYRNRYFWHK
jgi:hypothetical protein